MIVDDDLIAKYLSGEATPEEAVAIMDWLEVRENKRRFDELAATWEQSNPKKQFGSINKQEAWIAIRPSRPLLVNYGIAASVVLLIAVVAFWYADKTRTPIPVVHGSIDKIDTVSLSDNSTIILNRNSLASVPLEFVGDTRELELRGGDAFFSVTKDPEKPFIIHANFADIKVLGTQFNVSVHEGVVEVDVNEGVVQVITATDSMVINKGFSASFRQFQSAVIENSDANNWAYASQKLVFKDTPVAKVIRAVEKAYSCEISLSNVNINNCTLTATFDRDSVEKIVHLISESLNLKLEKNGEVFILQGEGCP